MSYCDHLTLLQRRLGVAGKTKVENEKAGVVPVTRAPAGQLLPDIVQRKPCYSRLNNPQTNTSVGMLSGAIDPLITMRAALFRCCR